MIRSFFVPFVHSLHIEISLNLSVFLRDSLSENTSFTSFTVTTVKDVPHLWIRHNNREQAHTSADCANRYSPAFPSPRKRTKCVFGSSTCQTTHFPENHGGSSSDVRQNILSTAYQSPPLTPSPNDGHTWTDWRGHHKMSFQITVRAKSDSFESHLISLMRSATSHFPRSSQSGIKIADPSICTSFPSRNDSPRIFDKLSSTFFTSPTVNEL